MGSRVEVLPRPTASPATLVFPIWIGRALRLAVLAVAVLAPLRGMAFPLHWSLPLILGACLWSAATLSANGSIPAYLSVRLYLFVCALSIAALVSGEAMGGVFFLGPTFGLVFYVVAAHVYGRMLTNWHPSSLLALWVTASFVPLSLGVLQGLGVLGGGAQFGPINLFEPIQYTASVYRVSSTFNEPNYFGQMAGSVVVAGAVLWVVSRGRLWRRSVAMLSCLLGLSGLAYSGSVSAMVGTILAFLALPFLTILRNRSVDTRLPVVYSWLPAGGAVVLTGLAFVARSWIPALDRLVAGLEERLRLRSAATGSFADRDQWFEAAWDTFLGNPLTGGGWSGLASAVDFGSRPSAHNSMLTLLATAGIVGLATYLAYIVPLGYRCLVASTVGSESESLCAVGIVAAAFGLFVSSLLYDSLFSNPWVILLLGSLIGIGLSGSGGHNDLEGSPRRF